MSKVLLYKNIGKSIKLDVKGKGFNKIKGIYIGNIIVRNNREVYGEYIYGVTDTSNEPQVYDVSKFSIVEESFTRLPKELGDVGRLFVENNNKLVRKEENKRTTLYILDELYNVGVDKEYKKIDNYVIKNKKKSKEEVLTGLMTIYFEGLEFMNDVEDYSRQDMEEYGVTDIEDTRHVSLIIKESNISGIVLQEYFDINDFKFSGNDVQSIRKVYPNVLPIYLKVVQDIIRRGVSTYNRQKIN